MKTPTVSVVIPSYNHGAFIGEAIQSVLNQTFQDFELIVVDDASPDDSVEQIKKFKDARIRTKFRKHNQGGAYTNSEAVEMAKGKYVAVLSSDDKFHPEKLEKQVRFLEAHPECGAVFTRATLIDEGGVEIARDRHFLYRVFDKKNRSRYEWLNQFFYEGNCLCHPSVLIRKKVYDELGAYRPHLFALPDWDMWVRVCLKFDIHVMPERLLYFRILRGLKNASAPRVDTYLCNHNETLHILRHYEKITDAQEFFRIFPEALTWRVGDDNLKFLLAKVALGKKTSKASKQYGLTLLYELFSIEARAAELSGKYDFDHNELVATARETDTRIGLENARETLPFLLLRSVYHKLKSDGRYVAQRLNKLLGHGSLAGSADSIT